MVPKKRPWIVTRHGAIEKIDDNLWTVCGDVPGAPIQRRMAIVKLGDGRLLFYHAVPLEETALNEVLAWGQPSILLVGHDQHAIDAQPFRDRLGVKIYGPRPCEAKLRRRLELEGTFENLPIDPAVTVESLSGAKSGEPVVIVRSGVDQRVSLLFCDLLQNNPSRKLHLLLRLLGFGGGLKVPPVARLLFVKDRAALRTHLERLTQLPNLLRILPCHGDLLTTQAAEQLRNAVAKL